MLRHPSLLVLAAFAVFGQSGCAVWMLPAGKVPVQQDEPQELTASQAMSPVMTMVPGDIDQIGIGQYAKIWTSAPIDSTGPNTEPRIVAGRVLAMNGGEVVLSECVGFERPNYKIRQPLLQTVPYYGRLFKRTGVGVMPTPIPGELRLVKSSVLGACSIPDSEWDSFRQQRQFERIGVDFDFNSHR
ncbi:MAG: hypothetical protein JWP89_2516 [Schlesneria sp.]|nr:hypothetical protein [Schlesneria sp.]